MLGCQERPQASRWRETRSTCLMPPEPGEIRNDEPLCAKGSHRGRGRGSRRRATIALRTALAARSGPSASPSRAQSLPVVDVFAATLRMGSALYEGAADERPRHAVAVSASATPTAWARVRSVRRRSERRTWRASGRRIGTRQLLRKGAGRRPARPRHGHAQGDARRVLDERPRCRPCLVSQIGAAVDPGAERRIPVCLLPVPQAPTATGTPTLGSSTAVGDIQVKSSPSRRWSTYVCNCRGIQCGFCDERVHGGHLSRLGCVLHRVVRNHSRHGLHPVRIWHSEPDSPVLGRGSRERSVRSSLRRPAIG